MNIQPTSLPVLLQISADFVFYAGAGRSVAYHIASGDELGKEGFIQYCSKHYGDIALVDNEGQIRRMSSGAAWWMWNDASRRVVRRIVMEPTALPEGAPGADPSVFNRWYVLKQEMVKPDMGANLASIQILLDHLMYISDGDQIGVLYFLNWLAQLYLHPDVKIPTAIMMFSRRGRVGKSVLARLLASVFGPSMVKSVDGLVLHKNFMDAVKHQRIMVLNELARADRQDSYERFKSMVSENFMEFESKGKASINVKNITHYIVTTNNSDALPLMQNDGRFLVLRCESERRSNEYYQRLVDWIDGPGPALLAGVLAQWQFPPGWDPFAPVPQTEAAQRTQLESRAGLVVFLEELIATGKPPFDRDMGRCTALIEQLGTLYPMNVKGLRLNNKTLPAALAELGARQMRAVLPGSKGTKISCPLWCWRNYEKWNSADNEERANHFI